MGQLTHANRGAGATVRITTAQGEQLDLYKNSYALLIEVSDYKNGWAPLPSIPRELDAVAAELKAQGFHITRISNPNERELKQAFDDFIDNYGYDEHNRLLFFYSGHGYSFPNKDKGYLVPVDAPNPNDDRKGFLRKALSMDNILTWARTITAKHALFLFDSCFSGSVFQSKGLVDVPAYISQLSAKPVRQFITAGSATDEVPAKSTFTPAFVDGLKYKLADMDKDGYITGMELGRYLQKVVPQSVRQMPQYGTIRDYELKMGDFIFVNEKTQKPSSSRVVSINKFEPEMVTLPKGCFKMGSPTNEKYRRNDNEQQHSVCIDKRFQMGIKEVTIGEFRRFVQSTGYRTEAENNVKEKGCFAYNSEERSTRYRAEYYWGKVGFSQTDRHPVTCISGIDSQKYIEWLNKNSIGGYRLPTEIEWEYAARAGTKTAYFWGNVVDTEACKFANVNNEPYEIRFSCVDEYKYTAPVGNYRANKWGLYDMAGNVWEWTSSMLFVKGKSQLLSGKYANDIPFTLRGGSFVDGPSSVRSATRFWSRPWGRNYNLGFRLARTIDK